MTTTDDRAARGALRGHLPVLDAVRGVAILLVLAHNFSVFGPATGLASRALSWALEFGWSGVQLFFVLSGFLITGILLDTQRAPNYLGAFFGRRVLRIFPLYYAVLTVAFGLVPLLGGRAVAGHEHQAWLWTYLSNWAPAGHRVDALPHFWSLAVEEQFYLVWPFVVWRARPASLARVCGGVALAALGARVALLAAGAGPDGPYTYTVCRFDALALGAIAASLVRIERVREALAARRSLLGVGALALFVVGAIVTRGYPRAGVWTQTAGYSLLGLCFTAALLVAVLAEAAGARWVRALGAAPLRSIGKYSYGMYVFHHPLHVFVGLPILARCWPEERSLVRPLVYSAAATLATFVAAWMSFQLLERHFLGLKRRFVAERA